ncbi:MAG: hypothetical protein IJA89_08915 [Clostridia bacterium]|nr:hypothetical protein [Clostridia bacterium]
MKRIKKFLAGMLAMTCAFSALSMTACEFNVDEIIDKVKDELPFDDDKKDETPDDGKDDGAGETPDDGTQDDGAGETPDDGTDEEPSETPDEGTDDGAGDNTDEPTSGGNIAMTDGVQYLRAGGTYALSKSVAFLITDVEATSSTYTPVTSTLTAKVEPIDADQRVDWTYEFVNASSTWAKGKTLTDYMAIAPKSDGSTELAVTCKKSFGEPIKITCTSRANNNISASTVVDFLAVPELQTVTLGSGSNAITVNLGGETTVKWDIDGGKDYGGDLAVGNYKSSTASVYTKLAEVGNYDVFEFDLLAPDGSKPLLDKVSCLDGYLTADTSAFDNIVLLKQYCDDIGVECLLGQKNFYSSSLISLLYVCWYNPMLDVTLTGRVYNRDDIDEFDSADREVVLNSISENSLYKFVLHTEIGGAAKTYYSLMKLEIV